jgi:hypothetical protein
MYVLLTLPTPKGGGFSNYTSTTSPMLAFDGNDLPLIQPRDFFVCAAIGATAPQPQAQSDSMNFPPA